MSMSETPTLGGFLVYLAQEPEAYQLFLRDPYSLAKEYGLPENKVEALKSGDLFRIRHVIEHEIENGEFVLQEGAAMMIWIFGPTW